jgi:hypothetical protein
VQDSTGKILGRPSWWLSLKAAETRDVMHATPAGSGRWEYVEDRHADAYMRRGLEVKRVTVVSA